MLGVYLYKRRHAAVDDYCYYSGLVRHRKRPGNATSKCEISWHCSGVRALHITPDIIPQRLFTAFYNHFTGRTVQVDIQAGPGVMLISEGENPTTAFVHVIQTTENFNPAIIIGRRFGPFGRPSQPVDLGRLWSIFEEQISFMDDLQERVTAAMALRCPKMRQRALENIMMSGPGLLPPLSFPADSNLEDPVASYITEPNMLDEESTNDVVLTWKDEDINAEEGESLIDMLKSRWDEEEFDDDNDEDEDFNEDKEWDDDDDDEEWDDDEDERPFNMQDMYHHNNHMDKDMPNHGHHHHDKHDHDHSHMSRDGPKHSMNHFSKHGGALPDGRRPKPMPKGGLGDHHNPNIQLKPLKMPLQMMPAKTSEPGNQGPGEMRSIMDRIMKKLVGENMQDAVEVEMIPRPTISEEVPVNWGLWNEDGSLNGGLVLFSGLCAACAAVWSALLMQCAGGCYRQQGAMSSPQFIMLPGYSDSDDEDVDEDPKTVLKRQQKQNEGIVIAAEYITKP